MALTKPKVKEIDELSGDLGDGLLDPGGLRPSPVSAANPFAAAAFSGMSCAKSGGPLTTVGGSLTLTVYNAVTYDTDGAFNTATGVYTVPAGRAGYYRITGNVSWNAATSGEQRTLVIHAAGGTYSHNRTAAVGETDPSQGRAVTLFLSAGQTVHLQILSPASDQPITSALLQVDWMGV